MQESDLVETGTGSAAVAASGSGAHPSMNKSEIVSRGINSITNKLPVPRIDYTQHVVRHLCHLYCFRLSNHAR